MIDLSILKNLMGNDEAMVQKFLDIFKSQTPVQLQQLQKYSIEKDWSNVSNIAHAIKSQAKYLGLEDIAELAYGIERRTEEQVELEGIGDDIGTLQQKLESILGEI